MQLEKLQRNKMNNIVIKDKQDISLAALDKEVNFVIDSRENASLFLSDLSNNNSINIELKDDSYLHLSILADKVVDNLKITANLGKNSEISIYFADFAVEKNLAEVVINLNAENAKANWRLASLASNKDNKQISVSVYHNSPLTFARVDNYGVAKEDSKLVFAGTSHILKGSIKSKTQQNAKIMVFDPKSDAVAKPILKIDENDIEASHAAAVGKISEEHMFYLTSRGLSTGEAKMLITLGYLKPIFKGFDEDKIEYMNRLIEGRL